MTDTPNFPPDAGDHVILPDAEPDTIAAAAVALANTNGGLLVFPEHSAATVAQALMVAAECCAPTVPFGAPVPLSTSDGPALAVHVARGDRVYALDDGRVLVRANAKQRILTGDEIRALISARHAGDFEAEYVPGATFDDLDPELITEFMHARLAQTGGNGYTPAALLQHIGALTPSHAVTVAGILLFGREPARWLPDAGARFVRWIGDQRAREDTIDGPLMRVLGALTATLHTQTRGGAEPDYPADALREALFNAICHRDYRLRGDRLTVAQYADRLEITSPGGLPGYLTATPHMLGARYRRNPRVSWTLAQWGACSGSAQGLLGMIMSMSLRGQRPPEIESGAYHVTVRLYSARAGYAAAPDANPAAAKPLTDCQRALLSYARQRGSITFREARVHCADVPPAHLQTDLDELVERGHLRKIGARGSAYYILA